MTDEVKAYMESMGFVEGSHGDYWILPGSAPQLSVDADQAQFFYNAQLEFTRKVLRGVKRDVIGSEVHVSHVCPPDSCHGFKARHALRQQQRQAIDSMIKEVV